MAGAASASRLFAADVTPADLSRPQSLPEAVHPATELALLTLVIYAGVSLLERLLVTWD